MKDIVILGSGGFASEVEWLIERINQNKKTWNFIGFVDQEKNAEKIIGDDQWLINQKHPIYAVCAVGNAKLRKKIITKISVNQQVIFPSLIDPSVIYSSTNSFGKGCIVCAGSIITVSAVIGNHVIINLDSTVGHSAILEDYCTLYPSVNVSGNVNIRKNVEIGTGVNIIQGVKIGESTIIGAGSVVVKDLPDNCTAVGAPAKPIKRH